MTYTLGRGIYLGYFDLGIPGSYGYVFDNGTEPVLVAWAEEERKITVPGKNLAATDIMGAPASPDIISRYPVYITGADLSSLSFHRVDWGIPHYEKPDLEALSTLLSLRCVREKDAPLYPEFRNRLRKDPPVYEIGEPVTVELKICNFSGETKTVALDWVLPDGWEIAGGTDDAMLASPWSEHNVKLIINPANTSPGGFYEIQVSGEAPGRDIAPAYMRIQMGD
jgi:hypothetical protein